MDLGQTIVVYLGVALLLWYAGAAFYNRKLGVRVYRWLQPGLGSLGEITRAKWLGSSGSGARLLVGKAARPFRQVEVAFLLETRELLPLWLLNRSRGRRDRLIVRADLRSAPAGELEVLRRGDRRLRSLTAPEEGRAWTRIAEGLPEGLEALWRGGAPALPGRLASFLQRYQGAVLRLSLARKSPHLILEIHLPELMAAPAEAFFSALAAALMSPE